MMLGPSPVVIGSDAPPDAFPPDETALAEPNGLIAVGGDLGPDRLIAAYYRGIFPWYEVDQPILWWTPDPRCVLDPRLLHLSRSLRRVLKRDEFTITTDTAFESVIHACAEPRNATPGTWITPQMMRAYTTLHTRGFAHSIEVWRDDRLAGGLYGVALGAAFFGESMFSRETDASKVALVALCEKYTPIPGALVDCQVVSAHLLTLGARMLPRNEFRHRLAAATAAPNPW